MGKKNKHKKSQSNENAEIRAVMSQAESTAPELPPMEAGKAAERTAAMVSLDDEIAKLRAARYAALDAEIESERVLRTKALQSTIDAQLAAMKEQIKHQSEMFKVQLDEQKANWSLHVQAERNALDEQSKSQKDELARLQELIEVRRSEVEKLQEALKKQADSLNERQAKLVEQETGLATAQAELDRKSVEADAARRRYERMSAHYQEQIDQEEPIIEARVKEGVQERERTLAAQMRGVQDVNDGLVAENEQLRSRLNSLQAILKDNPQSAAELIASRDAQIAQLMGELSKLPSVQVLEERDRLKREKMNLEAANEALQNQLSQIGSEAADRQTLLYQNEVLKAKAEAAEKKFEARDGAMKIIQSEYDRMMALYAPSKGADARYAEIEMPYVGRDRVDGTPAANGALNELEWLDNIKGGCDEYGIKFNERILKAFHTALKTAEWSPLTILAGVSGTGKSELPRLYSHFGGIVFEPVAVQPNWDSQESMLGFFNSIDNRFDAQPLLRFLAQSQREWTAEYPGLSESVCMVLLDEMNLAHPELYFAQFLSKLELRRGKARGDVPTLEIKTGAGIPPYRLPLGRNVLWTGTMNQDETTKSLSDKVLDRSVVINFPRPVTLSRRLQLKPLNQGNRGSLLNKQDWFGWMEKKITFDKEIILPYKAFVEDINKALGVAGRAVGHRVWQSIEYYIANYPDVRAAAKDGDTADLARAMHIAFEDQIVQKIMPKLRGIDTRGKSKTDCLDVIKGLLLKGVNGTSFNLDDDFNAACELGYGQFMWQSANYLNLGEQEDEPSAEMGGAPGNQVAPVEEAVSAIAGTDIKPVSPEVKAVVTPAEKVAPARSVAVHVVREAPEKTVVPPELVEYASKLDKPLSRRDIESFLNVDKNEAFKILQAYNSGFRG